MCKLLTIMREIAQVRILVGDPVPVADLLRQAEAEQWPEARLYRGITARIADSLASLKVNCTAVIWCNALQTLK
jgi:hypothetical protein